MVLKQEIDETNKLIPLMYETCDRKQKIRCYRKKQAKKIESFLFTEFVSKFY